MHGCTAAFHVPPREAGRRSPRTKSNGDYAHDNTEIVADYLGRLAASSRYASNVASRASTHSAKAARQLSPFAAA